MEEEYWRQFWETGKVTDYLAFRNAEGRQDKLESEETSESDYSDRDGFTGITYR